MDGHWCERRVVYHLLRRKGQHRRVEHTYRQIAKPITVNDQDTANFHRLLDGLATYFEPEQQRTARSAEALRAEQAVSVGQLTATADQAAATAAYSELPAP